MIYKIFTNFFLSAFDELFLGGDRTTCHLSAANSPSMFTSTGACREYRNMTFERYWIPASAVQNITFWPRDLEWKGKELRGQVYNFDNFVSPTVILVHGFRSCIKHPSVLLPAGILFRNGFNIVTLDLRNHGSSPNYADMGPYITV